MELPLLANDLLVDYGIKIGISLIPVLIFFAYYFRNFVFSHSILFQSLPFFWGLILSLPVLALQRFLPEAPNTWIRAFVHAGMVEEGFRFIFIYFLIRSSSESFTVTEGVFSGVLLGLGFSFAENMFFSVSYDGFVILMRCVSSVPMHVFASGIMAYYMAYRHHCHSPFGWRVLGRRNRLAILAFVIPYFYHALFDYVLFRGGNWNYAIAPLLIIGFFFLEYLIAHGNLIISRNILNMLKLDADEMELIEAQKEYEKWLMEAQTVDEPEPEFFHNRWTFFNTIIGFLLILTAGLMLFAYYSPLPWLRFPRAINKQTMLALIFWMPCTIGITLLLLEKINYLYVHDNMLRLPMAIIVAIRRGESVSSAMALNVPARGMFLSGEEDYRVDDELELVLVGRRGKSYRIGVIVCWINRQAGNLPVGALVRYRRKTLRFRLYRIGYQWNKVRNRLRYGLQSAAH